MTLLLLMTHFYIIVKMTCFRRIGTFKFVYLSIFVFALFLLISDTKIEIVILRFLLKSLYLYQYINLTLSLHHKLKNK